MELFVFMIGAAVAGVGSGAAYQGATRIAVAAAAPKKRAGVLSYLAMGLARDLGRCAYSATSTSSRRHGIPGWPFVRSRWWRPSARCSSRTASVGHGIAVAGKGPVMAETTHSRLSERSTLGGPDASVPG